MELDTAYVKGETKFLVVGNECRLLDQKRTLGKITSINVESGFFLWEISDFEDKGKFWEVEFERATSYQFRVSSKEATLSDIEAYNQRSAALYRNIEICAPASSALQTNKTLNERINEAFIWIEKDSEYFRFKYEVDFQNTSGPKLLRDDLRRLYKFKEDGPIS